MADQPNDSQTTDPSQAEKFFDQLVGEGRKYANAEELAKAYDHASAYIVHLQKGTNELREELNNRMSLEDFLNQRPEQEPNASTTEDPTNKSPANTPPETEVTEPTKEDDKPEIDLAELVRKTLQEETSKQAQLANQEKVVNQLIHVYGDNTKAAEEVDKAGNRLGFTRTDLMDIANRSPEAFFELMGISSKSAPDKGGTKSTINTEALSTQRQAQSSTNPKEGTFEYYEQMRREDKARYYSSRIQNEMFKNARAMGEAFYN